jgi:hypothetical protein
MTKAQAQNHFYKFILPGIIQAEQGVLDTPMRRQAWNEYVDQLRNDEQITEKQAETWNNPYDV